MPILPLEIQPDLFLVTNGFCWLILFQSQTDLTHKNLTRIVGQMGIVNSKLYEVHFSHHDGHTLEILSTSNEKDTKSRP